MDNKSVKARFEPEEDGKCRGQMLMVCPVCNRKIREQALERYYEGNSENTVELCSDCREDFERDNDVALEYDTLNKPLYGKLLAFASTAAAAIDAQNQGLNERTAPMVAYALGGDAWQSGGGIWLIVKRTADKRVVTISPEVVNEYADEQAFEENRPKSTLVMG